jgi:hypothetical protein
MLENKWDIDFPPPRRRRLRIVSNEWWAGSAEIRY